MGRWLTDLAGVCRSTGFPVVEVDDWATRARGGTGGHGTDGYQTGEPSHVMVHHTASPPSADGWDDVNYCTFHDDDAPLCNLYLSRDGTIYVCAAAATNCNGSGQDPCHWVRDDEMNPAAIAIEAGNNGTGETWPPRQLDAYTALCGALCAAYGIPTGRIHAHWEYAVGRKVDPVGPARYAGGVSSWDMTAFRADVGTAPVPEPGPEPEPPEEDDVKGFMARRARDGQGFIVDPWLTHATPMDIASPSWSELWATGQYIDSGVNQSMKFPDDVLDSIAD